MYTLNTTSVANNAVSFAVEVVSGTVNYYAYNTNISGTITTPYGLGTTLVSGTFTISGTFGTQIGMVKSPGGTTQGNTASGFFGTAI